MTSPGELRTAQEQLRYVDILYLGSGHLLKNVIFKSPFITLLRGRVSSLHKGSNSLADSYGKRYVHPQYQSFWIEHSVVQIEHLVVPIEKIFVQIEKPV